MNISSAILQLSKDETQAKKNIVFEFILYSRHVPEEDRRPLLDRIVSDRETDPEIKVAWEMASWMIEFGIVRVENWKGVSWEAHLP